MQVSRGRKNIFSSYRITYIKFTTNLGNVLEGGSAGSLHTFTAPEGYAIAGIHGYSADEIDSIGAIYMQLP